MDARRIVNDIVDASGMSKSALSRESGVSRSLIDDYLHGRSAPTTRQIERLARAAGCTVEANVRPAPKRLPDSFVAVLEFGEMFPRKAPKPLVNLGPVWRGAQGRVSA